MRAPRGADNRVVGNNCANLHDVSVEVWVSSRRSGRHPVRAGAAALLIAAALSAAPVAAHAEVALRSGEELVAMGASGQPTLPAGLLASLVTTLNERYGTGFDVGSNVDNLYTPETFFNPTYLDGEIDLLKALPEYQGDDVTVFGVSQSAGIEGMALRSILSGDMPAGATLPDGTPVSAGDLPADIHWVVLSPPSMPQHGNAAGLFQGNLAWLMHSLYPHITEPFPTDNGSYTVDVYCGMYDPICDSPTHGNAAASANSSDAGQDIHVGYGKLTSDELNYEMNHGALLGGLSTDSTSFYLMPDIYNFGTDADPVYESYVPALTYLLHSKAQYDLHAPLQILKIDAGYDDANHPFEFTFNDGSGPVTQDIILPGTDLDGMTAAQIINDYAAAATQLGTQDYDLDIATNPTQAVGGLFAELLHMIGL